MDENNETVGEELMRRTGPALVGAGVGLLVGGPPGAVLGAVTPPLVEMFVERWAVGQRKAGLVFDVVRDLTGLSPADVQAWATGREERLDFACHVLLAAFDALSERKIRGLASVLAEGTRDDVWLDHGRMISAAARDLEAPHLMVLNAMIVDTPQPTAEKVAEGAWTRSQLQAHLPGYARSIGAIAATLDRLGMIKEGYSALPDDEGANLAWKVLPFGTDCHQHLWAVKETGR